MKTTTLILALFACLCLHQQVLAQSAAQPENDWAETDKAELRDQLRLLRSAIGTEPAKTPAEVVKEDKMAMTLDRALTLVEKLLTSIAGTIEKIAPDVFRIMVKQQYANAIGDLAAPWLLALLGAILLSVIRKTWGYNQASCAGTHAPSIFTRLFCYITRKEPPTACPATKPTVTLDNCSVNDGLRLATSVVLGGFIFIAAWIGLCALSDSIKFLWNPQYYAIKDFVEILLKSKPM
jgi:hypothetical protein